MGTWKLRVWKCLGAFCLLAPSLAATDWPSYRGAAAGGVDDGGSLPVEWDVETGRNVRFRVPLAGLAHSSPVVSGDRVFVTTAISEAGESSLEVGLYGAIEPVDGEGVHRWEVWALDKRDGRVLWRRTAHRGVPQMLRHTKSTHANSTPAVGEGRVVAFFGSEGLFAYDLEGELQWKRDFGPLDSGFFRVPSAQWGFAASPVIDRGRVIVQVDVQKGSFLAALDLATGADLWRVSRDDVPTWSTPTVWRPGEGPAQIVVNGFRHAGGYRLDTGEELWRISNGGDIPVPTPVVGRGLAFLTSAHGSLSPVLAVRPTARGDVTPTRLEPSNGGVAWSRTTDGGYMQTPLVYGEHLYVGRDNGILSCFVAETGELLYKVRLGTGGAGFTSSPVAGDGKIYFTSEMGDVFVVAAGAEHAVLAVNAFDDIHLSTPAISEGSLYFRTRGHLVAVAAP